VTEAEKLQAAVQVALAAGLIIGLLAGYGWGKVAGRLERRGGR
jgi:hypothetical protein